MKKWTTTRQRTTPYFLSPKAFSSGTVSQGLTLIFLSGSPKI
jgi:hypothetical protein